MKKNKILALLNTLALIAVIYINYLATSLPINGKTTGELSDAYPNLFVPAGFTFAIWGVIYLGLIAFVIYQLIAAFGKNKQNGFINQIGVWFLLSCIANGSWIFAWHYQIVPLSLGIMLVILVTLIMIYQSLKIGQVSVNATQKWLIHVPFSIYLGWITVATIANTTAFLVDINWDGFGILPEMWTIIVLVVGTYIGQTVLSRRSDVAYALVIIWAYFGIYSKRTALGADFSNSIVLAAVIGMAILGLIALYTLFSKKKVG